MDGPPHIELAVQLQQWSQRGVVLKTADSLENLEETQPREVKRCRQGHRQAGIGDLFSVCRAKNEADGG